MINEKLILQKLMFVVKVLEAKRAKKRGESGDSG
jgi:hypothetical protein